MIWVKLGLYNEKVQNVESTEHLTSREGSAWDAETNASNTGHAVLNGTGSNPNHNPYNHNLNLISRKRDSWKWDSSKLDYRKWDSRK